MWLPLQQEKFVNADIRFQISERAYFIWKQKGCPEGKALENWLEAEAELSKERIQDLPLASAAANQARQPRRKKRTEIANNTHAPVVPSVLM
jgi:hypothetical protein